MEEDRAKVFLEITGIPEHLIAKYGSNYCFIPLILDNLIALIKSEDYSVREATAAVFKDILTG